MMGMRLLEMDASDALDVIHVLFEEDHSFLSQDQRINKQHVRKVVYRDFYGMENVETRSREETPGMSDAAGNTVPHSQGPAPETKPYVPPTDPSQLMSVLGPPVE